VLDPITLHVTRMDSVSKVINSMLKFFGLNLVALGLVCLMPAPSLAQEASGLSLGKPLQPKREIGQPYIVERKDDWAIRCVTTETGNDPCEMFQLLVREEGTPIAEISMFPLPQTEPAVAGATILVPLETLLTAPLVIEFSDTKAKEYPYSYCDKSGCVVRVGFDKSDLDDLKKGTEVTMAISHILQPDQQLILPVSLIGFTAMFNKLAAAQ